MKPILAALLATATALASAAAHTGTGTLTLVPATTAVNKLKVKITGTASGFTASDTQYTNLTGTLNVAVDAVPDTGATSAFTITGGNLAMSNMNFTMPVSLAQTQTNTDGTVVTVEVTGTIQATGTVPIPLNSWIEWTGAHALTGAPFAGTAAGGGAPLGLAWAMGFDPECPASMVTPLMLPGALPSASLVLPATGCRAPLTLEQSDSLTADSWQPVPATAVSTGQNPLPAGTTGPVTIQWTTPAAMRFVRVKASQP